MAKTYYIPYEWAVSGEAKIQADSLEEAIAIVSNTPLEEMPNSYVGNSFTFDKDAMSVINDLEGDDLTYLSEEEF